MIELRQGDYVHVTRFASDHRECDIVLWLAAAADDRSDDGRGWSATLVACRYWGVGDEVRTVPYAGCKFYERRDTFTKLSDEDVAVLEARAVMIGRTWW